MNEPKIETTEQLLDILSHVSMKGSTLDFDWEFLVQPMPVMVESQITYKEQHQNYSFTTKQLGWFVCVEFTRPDCDTGTEGRGRGRKEFIEVGTSLSGVVKTAWLLIELMVRHELMEAFTYNGHRIFNPHHTVTELSSIRPAEKTNADDSHSTHESQHTAASAPVGFGDAVIQGVQANRRGWDHLTDDELVEACYQRGITEDTVGAYYDERDGVDEEEDDYGFSVDPWHD